MRIKYKELLFDTFNTFSPIEKLDYILDFFDHQEPLLEGIEKMMERLGWDIYNNTISKELNIIVDKLIKDGYLLEKTIPQYSEQLNKDGHFEKVGSYQMYYISFEGRYFNSTGGYFQMQEDKALQRIHLKNEQRVSKRNEMILAAGAIFGIIALIFQALKWIYLHYYLFE